MMQWWEWLIISLLTVSVLHIVDNAICNVCRTKIATAYDEFERRLKEKGYVIVKQEDIKLDE